jgi:hypothetical protein
MGGVGVEASGSARTETLVGRATDEVVVSRSARTTSNARGLPAGSTILPRAIVPGRCLSVILTLASVEFVAIAIALRAEGTKPGALHSISSESPQRKPTSNVPTTGTSGSVTMSVRMRVF